jgi:putative transposase
MPNRITHFELTNIYHIYNRGVNKQTIFFTDSNYEYFIYKMANYFRDKAAIFAYCLMPNHFHLLIQISSEDFIRKALQPFLITYTRSVNIDQERIGPLFQGRYQANLINDDAYLLDCLKYIHLNPVKAGLVTTLRDWKYSSYRDYLTLNNKSFVEVFNVMKFFDSIQEFIEFSESEIEGDQSKYFVDYE